MGPVALLRVPNGEVTDMAATKKSGGAKKAAPKAVKKAATKKAAPKKAAAKKAAPKKTKPDTRLAPRATAKKATAKKTAGVKLNEKQLGILRVVAGAGETGYAPAKTETRSLEALVTRKLVKKSAKDKATGTVKYMVTKLGAKHAAPAAAPGA
jgi:hypothetical protein